MKKFVKLFYFICIAFLILVGCNNKIPIPASNSNDDLISWLGKYEFFEVEEIHSDIRPNPVWVYTIDIYKENADYYATIEVDGFQTLKRLKTIVKGDKEFISFIFEVYLPDNYSEPYEKNDIIISLEKKESEIYTYWGKLEPFVDENQDTGKIYFEYVQDEY